MSIEMEEFNINELAGASGLILSGIAGLLVVIFKSRCFCKFRIGFNDNCSICMCERKPPPDNVIDDSDNDDDKNKSPKKKEDNKDENLIPKKELENDIELKKDNP